jgi:hypothetical protein
LKNPLIRDKLAKAIPEGTLADTTIECPEIVGKVVHCLRLISSNSGSQEVHLEFTDGTAFSLEIEPTTTRNARLIIQSDVAPELIKTYDE